MIDYSYIKNPRSKLLIDNLQVIIYQELSLIELEKVAHAQGLLLNGWFYDMVKEAYQDLIFRSMVGWEDNHIENFINEWRLKRL